MASRVRRICSERSLALRSFMHGGESFFTHYQKLEGCEESSLRSEQSSSDACISQGMDFKSHHQALGHKQSRALGPLGSQAWLQLHHVHPAIP